MALQAGVVLPKAGAARAAPDRARTWRRVRVGVMVRASVKTVGRGWQRVSYTAGSGQQGLRKLACVEGFQLVEFFAHTDEIHGDGPLAGNGRQHAALGGTVQLGND